MISARRFGQWSLYGIGGLLACVVLLRVALGIYLGTTAGRAMVARQIGQQIGMPVEVTELRLGFATSSIGMKVFDPAAPKPSTAEVLAVGKAKADVSLIGIALGRVEPEWVTLDGVTLTIHVAADGTVTTTLPRTGGGSGGGGYFPSIQVTGGKLTVRQEGRPEFSFQNLELAVTPAGNAVKLAGGIDDPAWSKWAITGEIDSVAKSGWVEIATPDGPLTMDRLSSVPFVPPAVWERVRADGRGGIAVRLWAAAGTGVEYSVEIKPAAAALTLPDASLTLTRVEGLIRISGAKVTLAGTHGEVAGGTIAVDGTLDFGSEPATVALKVSGQELDIRRLPADWELPKDFEGKLKGSADISLRIHPDGRVEPEGNGEGLITGVKVLGFPGDDIPINLRKRGNRLEFRQPKKDDSRGARTLTRTIVQCAAPRQEKKPADPSKKDDDPVTLDANIRLRDVEISELLEKVNVKLDYRISGKITVEAAIAVPAARAATTAAYQFTGKVSSAALKLEGLTVRDLSAKMVYQDGKFTLTDLSGKIDQPGKSSAPPGTFRGTASAAISPPGDATATFSFEAISLEQLVKAVPDFNLDVRGSLSGKTSVKTSYEKLRDPTAWSGSAELNASTIIVEGRTAKDVRFSGELAKGVLTVKEARATIEGIPVTGEATLGVAGEYPFTAVVRTVGTEITDLRKLVPEVELPGLVEGVLETESKVVGTLSPLTFTATGTVKATKLTLGRSNTNQIEAKWGLTRDRLTLSNLKADVFGGTITGSADVPFDNTKAGKFEVAFKDLDVARATELIPDFPIRLAGMVTGNIGGTIPVTKLGESRVGNIDLDITAPKLTVQGIPAERLVGKAALKGRSLEYQLEGKTLGGSFEIKGRYPGQKKPKAPGEGAGERGSLKLSGVDLSRIATDAGIRSLALLRGRIDARFDFDNDLSAGSGRANLTNLAWGNTPMAREISGIILLRDGALELTDLAGRVAGGELRVRARVLLNDTSRNYFNLTLSRADGKRLLAPFVEDDELLHGPVSLVVRGRLGRETRASGTISMGRGSVSGIEVSELRIPFEAITSPSGYGRLTVHEANVTAESGRARANFTVDWGFETRMQGQVQFLDVPLRAVAPGLGDKALFGNGRVTGRFDFTGQHVKSLDDLNGTLIATLSNTSVRELPLLRFVTPFLNASGLVKPFQSGDIRGTLSKGVFRVQRFALANPAAQLFADGTVTTSGRVDLNVVAHVGTIGPDVRGLRLLGLRLPTIGPVPVGLIRDVSDFLTNQTIRLSVTGTTSNPVVRLNVGALLQDQAVRFFLSRYVAPAEAAAIMGLGSMTNK
ncbi:MAG: hypothetical protein C0467_14660 [Planctomycetaceae bacterium]|nr:hypothetical protein [Planctomycetaceae bacterium]